jgi:hypothetical protein
VTHTHIHTHTHTHTLNVIGISLDAGQTSGGLGAGFHDIAHIRLLVPAQWSGTKLVGVKWGDMDGEGEG